MGWTSTFFGNAKSSSSSSSSTTTNIDKRLVVDTGSVGISADHSTVTVNASDHGAIAAAFDLAKSSNAQTYKGIEGVLGLAGSTLKLQEGIGRQGLEQSRQGLEATQKVLDAAAGVREAFAEASNIAAGNKTLVSAGLAVVGLAAIGFALTRWKAA